MKRWLFLLILCGCTPESLEDVRAQGEAETRRLVFIFRSIDSKSDLEKNWLAIQKQYSKIADLVLALRKISDKTASNQEVSPYAEELFLELARLYELPGCKELIESAQGEAIRKMN
jgi:hypothetical protein